MGKILSEMSFALTELRIRMLARQRPYSSSRCSADCLCARRRRRSSHFWAMMRATISRGGNNRANSNRILMGIGVSRPSGHTNITKGEAHATRRPDTNCGMGPDCMVKWPIGSIRADFLSLSHNKAQCGDDIGTAAGACARAAWRLDQNLDLAGSSTAIAGRECGSGVRVFRSPAARVSGC